MPQWPGVRADVLLSLGDPNAMSTRPQDLRTLATRVSKGAAALTDDK